MKINDASFYNYVNCCYNASMRIIYTLESYFSYFYFMGSFLIWFFMSYAIIFKLLINKKMKKIIWYISLMIILILACFWFKYYVSHSWYCLLDEWIIDDWSYDKWELYLWSLKRISDENLQYLVNHIRSELILWLEELADSQAEIISKFNGDTIKLNNLKILTDEQAKILSQYTWFNLYLNWLEELTDVQTDNLVGNHSLYLEWLTNPTNEQLEIMVKNTWRQDLWLWLEEINEEQARILSQRKASLNLDKISEISDDVLEILLSWSIQRISLGWLTSLTDKQAELLSNYKGWLYLDGVIQQIN